jgi:hypothetical protein
MCDTLPSPANVGSNIYLRAVFSLLSLCLQWPYKLLYMAAGWEMQQKIRQNFSNFLPREDSNIKHLDTAALTYRCFAEQDLQLAYVNTKRNFLF